MPFVTVRPVDPAHTIPMPDRPLGYGRFEILPVEGRSVDVAHPFWAQALRDGSVVEVEPEPEPIPAPAKPAQTRAKD